MKLASWNVNGLKENLSSSYFKEYISTFDLNALVEIHQSKNCSIAIKGFGHFDIPASKVKQKGRRSGGIVLYYKKQFRKALTQISSASKCIMWVRIDKRFFTNLDFDIYLAVVYAKPNTLREDNNFTSIFERELLRFSALGKIMLAGDFNARTGNIPDYCKEYQNDNVPLPESYVYDINDKRFNQDSTMNVCGKYLINICKLSGLRLLNGRIMGDRYGAFTCYRTNGKSVVDYCLVDTAIIKHVRYFKVDEITDLSDHCLIHATFDFTINTTNNTYVGDRIFPKWSKYTWTNDSSLLYEWALLNNDIQAQHVAFLTNDYQINPIGLAEAVKDFVQIMTTAGDRTLTKRTFNNTKRKTYKQKTRHKWFDANCEQQRKELNILAAKLRKCPFDQNLHTEYFVKRKHYRKCLKQQKRKFKDDLLAQLDNLYDNDPKRFWNILDQMKNPQHEIHNPAENISPSEWTAHFKNISRRDERHTQSHIINEIDALEQRCTNEQFKSINNPITISEIKHIFKTFKNNKATGPDLISYEMLKAGTNILVPSIAKLFNIVLSSQSFPLEWNITAITPLHKKGSQFDTDNYRGISITSCLGKCFTSIMANRLMSCIETSKIFPDNQAAFRKNMRTTDHIYTLKSIINKYCLKQKSTLYACFVD